MQDFSCYVSAVQRNIPKTNVLQKTFLQQVGFHESMSVWEITSLFWGSMPRRTHFVGVPLVRVYESCHGSSQHLPRLKLTSTGLIDRKIYTDTDWQKIIVALCCTIENRGLPNVPGWMPGPQRHFCYTTSKAICWAMQNSDGLWIVIWNLTPRVNGLGEYVVR